MLDSCINIQLFVLAKLSLQLYGNLIYERDAPFKLYKK